jgi:hypothetical protein
MAARPKLSLPPTPQIGQVILRLCRRQPTFSWSAPAAPPWPKKASGDPPAGALPNHRRFARLLRARERANRLGTLDLFHCSGGNTLPWPTFSDQQRNN